VASVGQEFDEVHQQVAEKASNLNLEVKTQNLKVRILSKLAVLLSSNF